MSRFDDRWRVVREALAMVGEEALPLMPRDAFPDEREWRKHRALHTLVRLARLVSLDAPRYTLATDMALARRRLDEWAGPLDEWLGPAPAVPEAPEPEGPMPCLNCDAPATEERDDGIPMCAACGAAWDRGEWGEELR